MKEVLEKIGDAIVEEVYKSLIAQGHNVNGSLLQSIVSQVDELSFNILSMRLYFNDYGAFVDRGVKAQNIPFSIGSGAKQSKYINALIGWVRARGIVASQKEAKSVAFAIAQTHKKEGMPTNASKRFSKTGKRTGFFSDTLERLQLEIDKEIELRVGEEVEFRINNILGID